MIDPVILPSAFYWPPELSIWLINPEKASYQAVINIPDADCCFLKSAVSETEQKDVLKFNVF